MNNLELAAKYPKLFPHPEKLLHDARWNGMLDEACDFIQHEIERPLPSGCIPRKHSCPQLFIDRTEESPQWGLVIQTDFSPRMHRDQWNEWKDVLGEIFGVCSYVMYQSRKSKGLAP